MRRSGSATVKGAVGEWCLELKQCREAQDSMETVKGCIETTATSRELLGEGKPTEFGGLDAEEREEARQGLDPGFIAAGGAVAELREIRVVDVCRRFRAVVALRRGSGCGVEGGIVAAVSAERARRRIVGAGAKNGHHTLAPSVY